MPTMRQNKIHCYEMPLIGRLVDGEPTVLYENGYHHLVSLDELLIDIKQNLENILNTRSKQINIPARYQNLTQSLLNYGITDFCQSSLKSPDEQRNFCKQIKYIIECFETRMQKMSVMVVDMEDDLERILHLRIEGIVWIHPRPKKAVFESKMNTNQYQFSCNEVR